LRITLRAALRRFGDRREQNFSTLTGQRAAMRAKLGAMLRVFVVLMAALIVLSSAAAWAYTCPVVIKQAEDLIKKAEAGKVTPETRPLIDEAKKLLGEARAHHENAKTKRDHGDAVRKARTAVAFAEEAIILQSP
jgi:ArsR family metal-binding transcriptional regulator